MIRTSESLNQLIDLRDDKRVDQSLGSGGRQWLHPKGVTRGAGGEGVCRVPFQKIFRFTRRANHLYKFAPSRPTLRGVSRSSRTRDGMRWTRQRLARDGIAGRVLMFP